MAQPTKYFVRVWTVDPNGEGPDTEKDSPADSAKEAMRQAAKLRHEGKLAGAFERRNIRYPSEAPAGLDLPWYLYEFETEQLDADD